MRRARYIIDRTEQQVSSLNLKEDQRNVDFTSQTIFRSYKYNACTESIQLFNTDKNNLAQPKTPYSASKYSSCNHSPLFQRLFHFSKQSTFQYSLHHILLNLVHDVSSVIFYFGKSQNSQILKMVIVMCNAIFFAQYMKNLHHHYKCISHTVHNFT